MAWMTAFSLVALALVRVGALRTSSTVQQLHQLSADNAQVEGAYANAASKLQQNGPADIDPSLLYPAYYLSVPIDHFQNDSRYEPHTNVSFKLRYWFDASHYQHGGPVIVLQSGETSGVNRLPFLQKGIVSILARATGGLGVILEHRYYGQSVPGSDLSAHSLRFLTTDQSVADMAYFAQHVQFPGLEHLDLTPSSSAYIAYGGSYAGAFVALLRKLYPHVYWGAISSSGVTEAIYEHWQYYEAARLFMPGDCSIITQKLVDVVDNILLGKNGTDYIQQLKSSFGLPNVTRSEDFANAINCGVTGLQDTNWDPAYNDTSLGKYCDAIGSDALLYNFTGSQKARVTELLEVGGHGEEAEALTNRMLNYIGFVGETVVPQCADSSSQDECLTGYNADFYKQDDIKQTWRSWPWQFCTEWGYMTTGSGVPQDQLPMLSRLIDLNYLSVICRDAFNITQPPQVERINRWGGFNFSYPRLAFIDGEHDPWRQATVHAIGLPDRISTTDEPFILIDNAVHHWDENGLFPNETTTELPPAPIKAVQAQEVAFVKAWMREWKQVKGKMG